MLRLSPSLTHTISPSPVVGQMDASTGKYEDPRISRRNRKVKRDSFTSNFLTAAQSSLVDIFLDTSDGNRGPSFRRTLSRTASGNNGSLRPQGTGGSPSGIHQRRLFYTHDPPPPATIHEYHWCTEVVMENLCKFLIIAFMVIFIFIMALPQVTYWIQEKAGMGMVTSNNSMPMIPSAVVDPATARLQALRDMILTKRLTSYDDLTTAGTSQYLAAQWVSQMDPAQLDLILKEEDDDNLDNLIDTNTVLQRYAMVTLYTELGLKKTDHNTGDPLGNETKWFHNASWLSERHICNWHGVHCEDDGHVVHLNMTRNNLHGSTLPSELIMLSDLVVLDIRDNRVGGRFPDWIDQWQYLEYFMADNCQLSGSLPESLGNMTRLRELHLSRNKIVGNLTSELNSMPRLRALVMDHNALVGSIPHLGNLASTLGKCQQVFKAFNSDHC
jgi:hypothetical protein